MRKAKSQYLRRRAVYRATPSSTWGMLFRPIAMQCNFIVQSYAKPHWESERPLLKSLPGIKRIPNGIAQLE